MKPCDSAKDNNIFGGLSFKRFHVNVFLWIWLKTNFFVAMQPMENICKLIASHQLWPCLQDLSLCRVLPPPQGLHDIFAQMELSLFSSIHATILSCFFSSFPAVTSQPSAMFHSASTCQIMGFCDVFPAWLVCDHPASYHQSVCGLAACHSPHPAA